jgi:triosephosphate isomerase
MKKVIAANWKNNGSKKFIKDYFDYFLKNVDSNNEIIIFPPDLYISQVNDYRSKKNFMLGGQNINYVSDDATLTSGHSSDMFIDNGCHYTLVGHSEVRGNDITYNEAANSLQASNDLQVIFCVGESADTKKNGNTQNVISRQLEDLCNKRSYPKVSPKKVIVAYEPVWAIGTGNIPKIDDISFIHRFIKTYVSENHPFLKEKDIMVLYGGSVNLKNAKEILSAPYVDGVLIGGASLDTKEFTKICNLKI